jgi:D-alanyl-D-alanine dipeptidase
MIIKFIKYWLIIVFVAAIALRPGLAQVCLLEDQMKKQGLVNLASEVPGIRVDLRYSGKNNFLGRDIYGCLQQAYGQVMLAAKLRKASGLLQKARPGCRLLIYDAARPLSCQWALWKAIDLPESKKPVYVADPRRGSIHNYGCALDLSITDPEGKELDMGTGFDFFGELAQPRCEGRLLKAGKLKISQIENRKLLRSCMLGAGFSGTTSEWWHFNACSLKKAKADWKIIP